MSKCGTTFLSWNPRSERQKKYIFSPKSGQNVVWGQSYKTFYTLAQIYKLVLKLDNMLCLRK